MLTQKHFKYFKEVAIFPLSDKPQNLIDQFSYLDSNISSNGSDVNVHLAKVSPTINRLSILWKSDRSDKIKWDFFQNVAVSVLI